MEKVTLFSHILPEEQERMWICFQMREIVYENNEIIMEYTDTMKKIGLIAEGQASLYGSDAEGNQYLMDELKKMMSSGNRCCYRRCRSIIMSVRRRRRV